MKATHTACTNARSSSPSPLKSKDFNGPNCVSGVIRLGGIPPLAPVAKLPDCVKAAVAAAKLAVVVELVFSST